MRVPGAFSRRNGSNMSTDKNTRFVRGVSQKRQNWKFGPHVFTPSFPRSFFDTPHAKPSFLTRNRLGTHPETDMFHQSPFPILATLLGRKHHFQKNLEGLKRPDQEEGLGRCVVHGCGEVSAEMSKVMVSREECQHFDRRGERMTRTRKDEQ